MTDRHYLRTHDLAQPVDSAGTDNALSLNNLDILFLIVETNLSTENVFADKLAVVMINRNLHVFRTYPS